MNFHPSWQQIVLLAVLLTAVIVSHIVAPLAVSVVTSIVSTVVGFVFGNLQPGQKTRLPYELPDPPSLSVVKNEEKDA